MKEIRFSQLSKPRQLLIRACQRVNHGSILNVAVTRGEVDLDSPPIVLTDLHLASEHIKRRELELADFILPGESCRLFSEIDSLHDAVLEKITVFEGIPRRILVRRQFPSEEVL